MAVIPLIAKSDPDDFWIALFSVGVPAAFLFTLAVAAIVVVWQIWGNLRQDPTPPTDDLGRR
jgi:hypothetical protein